ncbi:hypothetical protein PWEIH_00550 [Listeria weihenstephanensis FSL R9-0317]|uniref:Uncharacterized protein n=1 Tax=Listeria weihenstephanensis TaxID=1006155 RepID=A0A1S7FSS1_9LIST|nr:hypothetical protein [Listeria weihenstephanensis]AQY50491.1 hypothetical protein UE46_05250 [Listeria phage LWP01] [Listeria weihenstephanensis]AQY52635.1 hypothetical protein UE46_p05250 [Listeria phage LWP01]EUJ41508.1 hypothetical protein PWEIH_00550 [Listeria weihenstephanensis FSL R9-0317]
MTIKGKYRFVEECIWSEPGWAPTMYLFERVSDGKRVAVPPEWDVFVDDVAFDATKVARKDVDELFKEDEVVS